MTVAPRYRIAQLDEIEGVSCPCGTARRAFHAPDNDLASVHLVDVSADSRPHYHKRLTEVYYILEGEGWIELDGTLTPVRPHTSVMIHPGTRHRAIGNLKILNVVMPPFDPADEWED